MSSTSTASAKTTATMPSHTRASKRSSSSSRHHPSQTAAHVQDWADDDDSSDVGPTERTHNTRDGQRRRDGIPHAPPSAASLDDDLQDIAASHAAAEHALGDWHYAPLILGLGPSLGAILGGKADHWSDAILLLLSCFWLYQCLKVPSDIYHAARTRRILQADQLADDRNPATPHTESPERIRRRQLAIAELQRTEVLALIGCVVSPILGAYALQYLQRNLHDGQRYFNQFNIRLFMMAAGIRPWLHAFKLIKSRTLLLHEDVHYPSGKVESLQRRIVRLEADLSSLRKSTVSKSDVNLLREGIDVPLSYMSRSMRRYEKKEEYLRNISEDKFSLVEARLEDLLRECAINAELIEAERLERERGSSFSRNIFEAFKLVVGHRRRDAATPAIAARSFSSDGRALPSTGYASGMGAGMGAGMGMGMVMGSNTSPPRGPSGPPSPSWNKRHPLSPPPSTTQHASLYAPGGTAGGDVSGASGGFYDYAGAANEASLLKYPAWYERGMLYYAFLPLNLTNSVLRYTGDVIGNKVPSVIPGANASVDRGRANDRKMIGPPLPPNYLNGYSHSHSHAHVHAHGPQPSQHAHFSSVDNASPPRNGSRGPSDARDHSQQAAHTYHLSPPMQLRTAANFAGQEAFSPFISGSAVNGGGGGVGGGGGAGRSGKAHSAPVSSSKTSPLAPMNLNQAAAAAAAASSNWRKSGAHRGVKV